MKNWGAIFAGLALACAATLAPATELGVLSPVMAEKSPVLKARPDGTGSAPVLSRVTTGALYEALQKEASSGFTADMLALDDLAMQIAGSGKNT